MVESLFDKIGTYFLIPLAELVALVNDITVYHKA